MEGHVDLSGKERFLNLSYEGTEDFSIPSVSARPNGDDFNVQIVKLRLQEILDGVSLNKSKFATSSS
jgi:hypothetical protein